jgi:hypothetical protein
MRTMKKFFFTIFVSLFILVNYSFCQSTGSSSGDDLSKAKELLDGKKYDEAKTLLQKMIDENGK